MSILVIADHDNTAFKNATLNAVAAATKIGEDITVLVAGGGCQAAAQAAAAIAGVSAGVFSCEGVGFVESVFLTLAAVGPDGEVEVVLFSGDASGTEWV